MVKIRFEWFGTYRNEGSFYSEEELMINCVSVVLIPQRIVESKEQL